MSWLSVRAVPEPGQRNAMLKALFELGSQGVQEEGDALLTHFPDAITQSEVERALSVAGHTGRIEFNSYEAVNWAERWKDSYTVQLVDAIRVAPPWLKSDSLREGEIALTIEPGMAFGTGEHESTRCALKLMQRFLKPGDSVADLGSGSAILSIAAVLLGASHAVAIENDADAIENANENVRLNNVEERVVTLEGNAATLLPLVAPVKLVLANIVSSVLIALLPVVRSSLAPDGIAILSGILCDERQEFVRVIKASNWIVKAEVSEESWCALAIQ